MAEKLPKGTRKFIRKEIGRIRKTVMNIKDQQNLIADLKKRFVH